MGKRTNKYIAFLLVFTMLCGILPIQPVQAIYAYESEQQNQNQITDQELTQQPINQQLLTTEAYTLEEINSNVNTDLAPYQLTQHQLRSATSSAIELNFSDLPDETISATKQLGPDGFFTINAADGSDVKINANPKSIDGFVFTKRFQFQGTGSENARSISFTVSNPAKVTVYGITGSGTEVRPLSLYKSGEATSIATNNVDGTIKKLDYTITEAGTYYLMSDLKGINIYYISVEEEGGAEVIKKPWNQVPAPIINTVIQNNSKVTVSFDLITGSEGADSGIVIMTNETGTEEYDRQIIGKNASSARTIDFTPPASGNYKFTVYGLRANEEDKTSNSAVFHFTLPLTPVQITNLENKGNGSILVTWNEVKEAQTYEVSYKKDGEAAFTTTGNTTSLRKIITGLQINVQYTIKVTAIRNLDTSEGNDVITTTPEAKKTWAFSAFGPSTNKTDNAYQENADGTVQVWSENGKGKLCQPIEPDGLAFYYTVIDAENENFELSATVTVDNWKNSGGQDGFGLLATDTIGVHGETTPVYNNMVANFISKMEYTWDTENNKVSNVGSKISMKAGIGALEKTGATPTSNPTSGTSKPLELSCANLDEGGGTYNIIGNYEADPGNTVDNLTEFKMVLKRNNTGYYCIYYAADGTTVIGEQIFYDIERTKLTQVDNDNIYVGFFAARNARITVSDINLNITDPLTDPPAEEREMEEVDPNYQITSPTATGISQYNCTFRANADGKLTITTRNGIKIAENQAIKANTNFATPVNLLSGNNQFQVTFTPDPSFKPSEFEILSDYGTKTFTHTVSHKTFGNIGESIYVAPNGTSFGTGSIQKPLDIYTAVSYIRPGQMILLAGGTYQLSKTIKVERGIDGTAAQMIYMIADPQATTRPVFDFGYQCAGMVLGGSYWYFQGFDVTKTMNMQKGIQVSGNNCTYDQINTYYNGNTGLQISRFATTDEKEEWPSNNLILNCTSYGNADRGYEDADGFAAKLTVGEGNVFRGCIAHNNADDGWDLFAKVETGAIGKVVIENCIAYDNGILEDGTIAGNGNGFKMGGSNFTGYHELINSIAYGNLAKGIDSNSCPDIKVVDSTSYNNNSYNVAFYTNTDSNTDFSADGIISYKTVIGLYDEENIKPRKSQDLSKIYGATNYYWGSGKSVNTLGAEVSSNWFVSLDTSKKPTRTSDGSITMDGLLELTELADQNAGARLNPTPSMTIGALPIITDAPEQNSSLPSGSTTETESGEGTATDIIEIKPEITLPSIDKNSKEDTVEIVVNITDSMFNSALAGKDKALGVSIALSHTELSTFIKNLPDEIGTIQLTINLPQKRNNMATINEIVLRSEIYKAASKAGKNLSITISAEKGTKYTWFFDAGLLKSSKRDIEKVNLAVDVNDIDSLKDSNIVKLLQKDGNNIEDTTTRGILMSFHHEGRLPATAKVKIQVGENSNITGIEANSNVYLYHIDPASGKLQNLPTMEYMVDKNGFIAIDITHCSDYVILPKEVKEKNSVDLLSQISVKGVGTLYTTAGSENKLKKSANIQITLPTTLKKVQKFSTTKKDLAVEEVRLSYKSNNTKIATVSANGKVTAKGKGSAVITVTAKTADGVSKKFKITVKVAKGV